MLTGTTKTGAVRNAPRQMLESLSRPPASRREDRLTRFLEEEIWPLIPAQELGRAVSKADEPLLCLGDDFPKTDLLLVSLEPG